MQGVSVQQLAERMKKQDILKVVRANEGTVLSFPDRGPWGNNRYRGNCSGYIHAFLIDQYDVNYINVCRWWYRL